MRYSSSDLVSLRESPLVAKPSGLPDIHQWIETPNDKNKQRRNDDLEDGPKRPNLAHARTRVSQSGDTFLGPKMSFAAASANRKEGERSISEEYKEKIERTARDPALRDWQHERNAHRRDRPDLLNGHPEESQRKHAGRRGSGGDSDRPRMKINRPRTGEGILDEESSTPRRIGFPEKLNKPWFRKGDEITNDDGLPQRNPHGSMRDDRYNDRRQDHNPSWIDDPLAPEGEVEAQSQQDFAAWKEMMKKGHASKNSVAKSPANEVSTETTGTGLPDNTLSSPISDQPLFGTWGQSLEETKKAEEAKKKAKPSKFSRFFNPDTTEPKIESVVHHSPEEPMSPVPYAAHSVTSEEDKKGFNNLMNLLRTKGSISQGQSESAFSPPVLPQVPQHANNRTPPEHSSSFSQGTEQAVRPPSDPSTKKAHTPEQANPAHAAKSRPQSDANSEFFMNLMKHSQPRAPFQEGQIYGQNYGTRRESNDIASIINRNSPLPQRQEQQAPPPGFFDNQRSFNHNQNMDISGRGLANIKSPDFPPQQPQHFHPHHSNMAPHDHHRGPSIPVYPFSPQPPDFGPPHPNMQHQRPSSQDGMCPPPGFAMRPNAPPGFSPFGPGGPGPGPNGPPNAPVAPQMRGPPLQSPPLQFNGQPPPGLGHGPHPGMGPQTNGQRMPRGNMQIPPGFDMYGDIQRRGGAPPPPPQSSYAQYLKQGGGPAAYHGM